MPKIVSASFLPQIIIFSPNDDYSYRITSGDSTIRIEVREGNDAWRPLDFQEASGDEIYGISVDDMVLINAGFRAIIAARKTFMRELKDSDKFIEQYI